MRNVCLWSQEVREFIRDETIAACWTHTHILMVALYTEMHNYRSVAKAKGKFKECFEELGSLFKSVKIDENPKEIAAPDIKGVSDNLDNDGIDKAAESKLDNDEEIVDYNKDE